MPFFVSNNPFVQYLLPNTSQSLCAAVWGLNEEHDLHSTESWDPFTREINPIRFGANIPPDQGTIFGNREISWDFISTQSIRHFCLSRIYRMPSLYPHKRQGQHPWHHAG